MGGASIEVEPQLPLCGMSLFCPPPVLLSHQRPPSLSLCHSPFFLLLSQTSLPLRGSWPLDIWEKSDAFCDFSSWFFSCSDIVQECMAGKQEGNCLISILYYSVDQFQQGFRERAEGEGENRIRAPTILFLLLFYLNFKDRDIQTCWRQSSGCCLLHSLERLGFLSGRQTAGGAQWLNVFGRHWPPPVQSDRWATVGVGGTSSEWGFFFFIFFF